MHYNQATSISVDTVTVMVTVCEYDTISLKDMDKKQKIQTGVEWKIIWVKSFTQ